MTTSAIQQTEFNELFAPEKDSINETLRAPIPLKILLVDDEPDIHSMFRLTIPNIQLDRREIQLFSAYSCTDAIEQLTIHSDIELLLLDVVMEDDDSGLTLAKYVRQELSNQLLQIVLVTGQPGYAPERKAVTEYEVNGYQLKSELNADKIFVIISTAVRAYQNAASLNDELNLRIEKERALELQISRTKAMLKLPSASEEMEEQAFMQYGLDLIESITHSKIAFIHFVNPDQQSIDLVAWSSKTMREYCKAEHSQHYPVSQAGIWADALRKEQAVIFNDYEHYLYKKGLPSGHAELTRLISVPIIEHGKVVMLVGVGNKEENYNKFDVETVKLIATDIWHYVQRHRTQQKLMQANETMHQMLLKTVKMTTQLAEMRDPYTSGHEQRVSEIAVAIGREMGMDNNFLEGLKISGYLHDIGKMSVPLEVLVKPGKLSDIEFQLIKEHPKFGYQILKEIDFLWPVAKTAWQHHERMNGSGYPQGLIGTEIILEARIIAVADVVEAMASHRPYRAGLGIEKALEEIEQGREKLYDKDVVDACLNLFRIRAYQL